MFTIEDKFLREQLDLLKRKKVDENIEWQDITDFRAEHIGALEHRDTVRKGSKLLMEYVDAGWVNEPSGISTNSSDVKKIREELELLQRERIKVQTEKLEQNRWRREDVRDEMIVEKIEEAIKNLSPLSVPSPIYDVSVNGKEYLLTLGDCHYGKDLVIRGLHNEIINEYSPEICEKRLWQLFYKVKSIIEKEHIDVLNVWNLGDELDGMLRVSQLMTLRYGVIDSAIMFAEIFATWLNELSRIVKVRFQMTKDSNHCELRELGQPKGSFKNDNLGKVILMFLKERLKDNYNIDIIENPTGFLYDTFCGYNALGFHGEAKNMGNALKDFSFIYNTKINYLIGAHIHHGKSEEVGFDTECINIPSVIGVDDYSMSIRKTSNPGAKLMAFEDGEGLVLDYRIRL